MPHAPAASLQGESRSLLVRVRKGGMEIAGLEVLDLSLAGCMLNWRGWLLQEDQRVMVSFPDLANLPATVLWADQDRVGLLFNQPLHEAVYNHLVKGHTLSGA